jgi:Amt family ammonium transporter
MLQSLAMIIVTTFGFSGFGFPFGPSIGGIMVILCLFFQGVGTNTAWVCCISLSIIRFISSKIHNNHTALITGAFAERIRFWAYLLFMVLFIILIYAPLCHMTWHPEGLFFKMGVLDFAGGTVIYECWLGSISWRNVFR